MRPGRDDAVEPRTVSLKKHAAATGVQHAAMKAEKLSIQ
jgi:hypothetical protein